MSQKHLAWIPVTLTAVLVISGCSSTGIKKENENLKQQMQQEAQVRTDYADKLKAAEAKSAEEKKRAQSELAALRRDLNKALDENDAIIQKLENLTVVDIEHSVLFKSGQAELSAEGKKVVKQMAEVFKQHSGFHMRIEGHTDNKPIHANLKQRYYSNWELSAARAATVVRYMIFALNVPVKSLSIAGYADNRPIASNDSEEGRAKNRRIRAVLFKG